MLRRMQWMIVLCLLLTAGLPRAASSAQAPAPLEVRVMSFNIWRGGELVNFDKVAEAIEAAQADVVGLQEAEGNVWRVADALGWQFANERTQIISRFPIIDPNGADGYYVYIQVAPGQVFAVSNLHLPSDPYGPYLVRDGSTLEEVLQNEADLRMPVLEEFATAIETVTASGMPIALTGDFNSPSHLDWTEATVNQRAHMLYPVEWPVSKRVVEIGMQDTFRTANPDPLTRPGATWTFGYPYPRLLEGETIDRIDFVYASADIEVVDSKVVGPKGAADSDIEIEPFPSDHNGVVSTLRLTTVTPPPFVAVNDRSVQRGDHIVVQYHAPNGEGTDRIGLVTAGGTIADNLLQWLDPYEASFFGSVTFGSSTLVAGEYAAVLIGPDDSELARVRFWVVEASALPSIATDKTTYAAGESITITWANSAGLRWDWIAIYSAGDANLYGGYWAYLYTRADVSGTGVFDASVIGEDMLPAGDYVARLMEDDGYVVLAESAVFKVTE